MSQQTRQGNSPHSITKFRETTSDNRDFDKVKEVGGAAKEAGPGRVQTAREAQHCDSEDETPRQGNQVHHKQPEPVYPQRQAVPKQSGISLEAEE